MATAEEQEAMVSLFEDKIMEMVRRRVKLQAFKSSSGGVLQITFQLIDCGREGRDHQMFEHGMAVVAINVSAPPATLT